MTHTRPTSIALTIALVLLTLGPIAAFGQSRNGPSGSSGGQPYTDILPGDLVRVSEVRVWSDSRISGIQVVRKTPLMDLMC